ncbi:peroxiredoxin [Yamadazyma tenuis]|uniref:Redoxin n=1 Tax=Candida tenuis (strain ATCC 10573 / BCRC 21748 / CBS 615 / JCM 9827 / NBRC 10315 / NRRL Y-1498 / VKM Y-70) TaxID=590646 RepID=G3BAZ2_CANTC|nr:Redoxin [Yamadazyma tenuis ATCC 10573]EGV61487.1 Redoxin [Yamadazyma tenuis ATCC 10573]WEJ92703.1 peroxiredoxin [Yamadazyma tenuis]
MSSDPTDFKLKYVPIDGSNHELTSCKPPVELDLAKEFASGKTVVVTGAPGAFTPTCTEQHIPDYLKHIKDFKAKGVDRVIVLTANDPFVNAAWGKALGYVDDENYFVFASDPEAKFSSKLGGDTYAVDMSKAGMGIRTSRYTSIIKDGSLTFLGNEDTLGFSDISAASTVLERL